jgi:hypothetical protein
MRKFIIKIIMLTFGAVLMCSTVRAGESYFDTVLDQTISSNTAGKILNLQGYREFALLARFDGGVANANKEFAFEIYNNSYTVVRETVRLNAQGWVNFSKVYTVFAPTVLVTVYNPPANLKTKITVYAAH